MPWPPRNLRSPSPSHMYPMPLPLTLLLPLPPPLMQAALVRLTDLEVGPPTIGFMITDALPHLQSQHRTNTHRAELAW